MSLDMQIVTTSNVVVDDETAADLLEAYNALKDLPTNRQIAVDFPDEADARMFVRQGKAWAESQDPALTFARKGDIKGNPKRVVFRIFTPNPRGALTEAQKAQRAATRAANAAK